jgi:ABC-2 type transport system permease protein
MNAWRMTWKDLRVLWRDRRSFVILIALPLVFITIIGLSTGQLLGWRNTNSELRIAVVNRDGGPLSQAILNRLKGHAGVRIIEADDFRHCQTLLDTGRCSGMVEFGTGFQSRVDQLRAVDALQLDEGRLTGDLSGFDVHVSTEPSLTNVAAVIELIVQGEVLRGVIPHVLHKNAMIRRYISTHRGADLPAADPGLEIGPADVSRSTHSPYKPTNVVYQTVVPSYTVLFTFFLVTIMAGSFLAERSSGTLNRLRTLPISNTALLVGKMLPYLLISIAQGALLFLTGRLLFGMSWGRHPEWLPVVICCTSVSATCLGALIATIVRTTSQITTIATLVIIVMAGISGCFMPRAWLPLPMQQVSLVTPHAWALMAYDQLLNSRRPDLAQVARSCTALVGISGSYLALGWWWFRRGSIVDGR